MAFQKGVPMLDTLRHVDQQTLEQIEEEKRVRKTHELFLLFSLGSQFDHLIKQEIEKFGVFCLVADPNSVRAADVMKVGPKGIVLSGGPASVHAEPPFFDETIFDLGTPVLGICLGFQIWAGHVGVPVVPAEKREFGVHRLRLVNEASELFEGCKNESFVLESHGDRVKSDGKLTVLARTENAEVAAAQYGHLFGVQFHPEVTETADGSCIFENFLFKICKAQDRFPARAVAKQKIAALREEIGERRVLLALSGGSDSSTVAYLLKEALSGKRDQLRAVYIQGIDRPDDEEYVLKYFGNQDWLELKIVDKTELFLEALRGKTVMHEKRVAMRGVYKACLEEEAALFDASYIVQGTLYTDVSESGGGYQTGARKAQIKLHHNVNLGFSFAELTPLVDCVKDSGRNIGRSIGVPEDLLVRHPFPGPGLVVRIEGEIDLAKLTIARKLDGIYIEELRRWGLYESVWQAGAVVTQSITTCTKGDDAATGIIVSLWAVWSVNGFTAQAAELPYDFLKHVSLRMTNEIGEVGAVVYRISGKPPSTIEMG
jgi:GMP synthase (glutamine-hydrolysing)